MKFNCYFISFFSSKPEFESAMCSTKLCDKNKHENEHKLKFVLSSCNKNLLNVGVKIPKFYFKSAKISSILAE